MKLVLALVLSLLAFSAHAQTPPPFSVPLTVTYQLPTTATDGSPLTGQLAITKVQLFLSASPIPDASTMLPTAEISTGLGQPIARAFSIQNGGTVYVRMKACHQYGCAEKFSNQATKVATVPAPGEVVITTVTIQVLP